MPRQTIPPDEARLFEELRKVGPGAAPPELKLRMLQTFRATSPESMLRIDQVLIGDNDQLRRALIEAGDNQAKLRELLDHATAPPWHPATFHRKFEALEGVRAMVSFGGRPRFLNFADGVDPDQFDPGDEVILNDTMNLVLGRSPFGMPQVGETALFDRFLDADRMVIKHRDDELVVDTSKALRETELAKGDQVRWERSCWMAFEKVHRPIDDQYLLKDLPDVRPEAVGGQRDNLRELLRVLTASLVSPDLAAKFKLPNKRSVLMVGPPGCGKTLMARVAASEIARKAGKQCRFFVVKPAEWESMWVGETQANIRRCFASMHKHAEDGYCVLFLDEVESVGRTRGSSLAGSHNDKFLGALLAEIDGFRTNRNIVLIAATNRKDMIDQALLERLGDCELFVRRPNMSAAREIFGIHLDADLPFSPNGAMAKETRQSLIELAVSRLYSPNADNQLSTIKFRDATTRTVTARELISGRIMEQICTAAKQMAHFRALDGGEFGLRERDMEEAVENVVQKLTSTLTRHNVRSYLDDLPQDVDIVSVVPVTRKVKNATKFQNA